MQIDTITELINELGNNTRVAAALGINVATVRQWKLNKSIPLRYWTPLRAFAKSRGVNITNDKLVTLHDLERIDP